MTTANKLTLLRMALIPVFLGVLYAGFPGSRYVALGVFVAASLTDFLELGRGGTSKVACFDIDALHLIVILCIANRLQYVVESHLCSSASQKASEWIVL